MCLNWKQLIDNVPKEGERILGRTKSSLSHRLGWRRVGEFILYNDWNGSLRNSIVPDEFPENIYSKTVL